jgi:hypothetical protein
MGLLTGLAIAICLEISAVMTYVLVTIGKTFISDSK